MQCFGRTCACLAIVVTNPAECSKCWWGISSVCQSTASSTADSRFMGKQHPRDMRHLCSRLLSSWIFQCATVVSQGLPQGCYTPCKIIEACLWTDNGRPSVQQAMISKEVAIACNCCSRWLLQSLNILFHVYPKSVHFKANKVEESSPWTVAHRAWHRAQQRLAGPQHSRTPARWSRAGSLQTSHCPAAEPAADQISRVSACSAHPSLPSRPASCQTY